MKNCTCGSGHKHHDECCPPTQINPCDFQRLESLGEIHRMALDAVANDAKFPNHTQEEIFNITNNSVQASLRAIGVVPPGLLSFKTEKDIAKDVIAGSEQVLADSINEGNMSVLVAESINYILQVIKDNFNASDVAILLNAYKGFVVGRTDMSPTEKASVVTGINIGISSTIYWNQAFLNPANKWNAKIRGQFTDTTVFKIKWWDLLGGVLNCIGCGAAGGGVAGCIGCAGTSSSFVSSIAGEK